MTAEAGVAETAPGRIRWQCRRGQKELDLLLGGWCERRWPVADASLRGLFERLLEQPDPELADWLLAGGRPADPGLASLVDDILRRPD